MVLDFGQHNLDENLHQRVPHNYFLSRENRTNYIRWLAENLEIDIPSVNTAPWYNITNVEFTQPITGERAFAKSILNHFTKYCDVTRNYLAVVMDSFPDENWMPWRIGECTGNSKWTKVNIWVDGITLPDQNSDLCSDDMEVRHITGREICRNFIQCLAAALDIDEDNWEYGWNNISNDMMREALTTQYGPNDVDDYYSGFGSFIKSACPEYKSFFSAIQEYFDDVDFEWREWLVGVNVPNGFGNQDVVGVEQARDDIQRFLNWYFTEEMGLVLDDNMDELHYIGANDLDNWTAICRNLFNGSPQQMIEFTFPGHQFDVTLFGRNRATQRAIYHVIRECLPDADLETLDQQDNHGWEHVFAEFGNYPHTQLPCELYCGGENSRPPSADIWVSSHHLMVDYLGEWHFEPRPMGLSNQDEWTRREESSPTQDHQRWQMCHEAGYHVIAIGSNFNMQEHREELEELVNEALGCEGPSFRMMNWPESEKLEPPEFEENLQD